MSGHPQAMQVTLGACGRACLIAARSWQCDYRTVVVAHQGAVCSPCPWRPASSSRHPFLTAPPPPPPPPPALFPCVQGPTVSSPYFTGAARLACQAVHWGQGTAAKQQAAAL